MDELKLLTTADVAERLGVSNSTVTLWCRQDRFPNAIKGPKTGRGAIYLIPEADLETFKRPKVGYPKGRPRKAAQEAGDPDRATD